MEQGYTEIMVKLGKIETGIDSIHESIQELKTAKIVQNGRLGKSETAIAWIIGIGTGVSSLLTLLVMVRTK